MTNEEKKDIVSHARGGKSIALGDTKSLQIADLAVDLTDEQAQQIQMAYAEGMVEVHKKALELGVDIKALDAAIGTMANQTEAISQAGDHVTMTHSQSSSLGRTEVIMGNTERAAKGKLTKSQTGEDDNTLTYVVIAAVIIILALLFVF